RATLASVIEQHALARLDARKPCLERFLTHPFAHDRSLILIAKVLGKKVILPVDGLAVARQEEDEHIAWTNFRAELAEYAIEVRDSDVVIQERGDLDVGIETGRRRSHRVCDRFRVDRRI